MSIKNRRVFELRLGKAGLIVFVIGMSLLLFSGFLIGVVVGKHMEAYPEQYAFGMMGLVRDRLIAASPKGEKKETGDVEKETFNLTFYDTLGEKKQVVPPIGTPKKELPADSPDPAASRTPPGAPSGEGSQRKQAAAAERAPAATGTQNPSPPQGAAAPQAKPASPGGSGRFEIQVAAYRDERQAQRMVKRFEALGYTPHVVLKDLSEKGIWFRVILGGFESREEAQEASERIVAKFRSINCVIRPSGKS
jgi:cell division septation protein DedD